LIFGSENDPRWTGGLWEEGDIVCSQVQWMCMEG